MHRWEGNPILTADDIPFPCNTVFNAAPAKVGDEYILLLRVEGKEGYSVLALARSDDGFHFEVDPEPVMVPCPGDDEKHGVEDPRITVLEDWYYICYTSRGRRTSPSSSASPSSPSPGTRTASSSPRRSAASTRASTGPTGTGWGTSGSPTRTTS
jgi:predicted GH43/DUF377 family glycosyl hydrolase